MSIKDDKSPKGREQPNDWIKYSGLGFQMIAAILVFVFIGMYVDEYFGTEPTLTLILALVGVAAGLYVALRDFL